MFHIVEYEGKYVNNREVQEEQYLTNVNSREKETAK